MALKNFTHSFIYGKFIIIRMFSVIVWEIYLLYHTFETADIDCFKSLP